MTAKQPVEIVLVDPTDKALTTSERQQLSLEHFRDFEESLYQESAMVVSAAVSFADVDPSDEEPPPEWVKQFKPRELKKRMRIAKAAWMNRQEAPIGLTLAMSTYLGIKRVREADTGPQTLNIGFVQMVQPAEAYPAMEIEGKSK